MVDQIPLGLMGEYTSKIMPKKLHWTHFSKYKNDINDNKILDFCVLSRVN